MIRVAQFTEDSDPIEDMGIGDIDAEIKKWFKGINEFGGFSENGWLVACATHGKTVYVKYLLSIGHDVHCYDDAALRWACLAGHTEIVKLLLDAGADVFARKKEALDWAKDAENKEIVKILKRHIRKQRIQWIKKLLHILKKIATR